MYKTIKIDSKKLKNNLNKIRKYVDDRKIIAVIKSNAYGHGSIVMTKMLLDLGVTNFAVATIEEAIEVRKISGKINILILGRTSVENLPKLSQFDLIQTIFSYEQYEELKKSNLELKVEIKVNSGMNRLGFKINNQDELNQTVQNISEIFQDKQFKVNGIFTHFFDANNFDSVLLQSDRFNNFVTNLSKVENLNGIRIHTDNSVASTLKLNNQFDFIRVGMLIYGIDVTNKIGLEPIMSVYSKVINIETIKSGESVSYESKFIAEKETKVATVFIGYADGIPIRYSEKGHVFINGIRVKIIGKITMDYMMVDVTNIEVNINDDVEIIGENIKLIEVSDNSEQIPYEILVGLGTRFKRIK